MDDDIRQSLVDVLNANHRGTHTTPAAHLYPHQWLWDSAFIAIGWRHIDTDRAKTEIESIFRGQWSNGMVPHMIFDADKAFARDRKMWASHLSPYSPGEYATTGITQPPMIAEAIVKVGQKLGKEERRLWYIKLLPKLIDYHQWLFDERDPHDSGLTIQVHPYETGLDNTPPWIIQLHERSKPWWIKTIETTRLDTLVNLIRRDTRHVPPGQRMSNIDALMYWDIIRRFRAKAWNIDKMLHRADFMIEDLAFNSIFVRANQHLIDIAHIAKYKLPQDLLAKIERNQQALQHLWHDHSGIFYCRDFVTRHFIEQSTIATLLPLYAGTIDEHQAKRLVELLKDNRHFGLRYPVPSVPLSSEFYNPIHYWQGPTWLNTNWLIIDGLGRQGFVDEAEELKQSSLACIQKSNAFEYFSPKTAQGLGARDFSWTAALALDLIEA